MKSVELNRKSWHYRLAYTYGNYKETDSWGNINHGRLNICSYTKAVFGGFLMTCLILVAGGLVAAMFGEFFAWLLAMYFAGKFIQPTELACGPIVITFLFVCVWFCVWFSDTKPIKKVVERFDNSFIGGAYMSFKDKVCFEVKFKE